MSLSIPSQIEQDINCGRAQYKTFQTGIGGQTVLNVPPLSYIKIFGYDFSPAGGGMCFVTPVPALDPATFVAVPEAIRRFGTQQISFLAANNFFPFIHHVPVGLRGTNVGEDNYCVFEVDNMPISRSVYIISDKDVAITVGLILRLTQPGCVFEAIPRTQSTPQFLTYGGDSQTPAIQSTLSPIGALTFTQPEIDNYAQYGFVAPFPGNAENQAFWVPNALTGLTEPSNYISTLGTDFDLIAGAHYYLNVHYALYTENIPENLG